MLPLGVTVELNIGGTWTDISRYVLVRDLINISGGAVNWGDQPQPATCTFTVRNADGRFSPNYAAGAYYPYLQRNVQVRVSVTATSASGNFYQGFRFWGEIPEWPPLSDISGHDVYVQVTASGPLRRALGGAGQGSALTRYYSQLTGAYAPVAYWPCEEDPSSGQIGDELGGNPMTIITGKPVWKAVSSFNGSAPVGVLNNSTWDGITGQFGTSGDDIFVIPGTHTWVASTSTVNAKVWGAGGGGANGTFGYAAGSGEFAQEATLAVTPGASYTVVVGQGGAGGLLSNSNVNSDGADGGFSSVQGDSVLVKAHGGKAGTSAAPGAAGTGSTNSVHHDGAAGGGRPGGSQAGGGGAGSAGSAAAGNPGQDCFGNVGGTGGFAGGSGGAAGGRGGDSPSNANGGPGAVPGAGGGAGAHDPGAGSAHSGFSGAAGKVELVYTPTGGGTLPSNNVLRFLLYVPSHGGNNGRVLVRALTSGTIAQLDVEYVTGGKIRLKGYNNVASLLFTSSNLTVGDGQTLLVSAELAVSGANVAYKLTAIVPGAATAAGSVTGTQSTATMGNVTEVLAGPNADITKTAIGHISVQYALIDIRKVSAALNGHDTEMSIDRFIRLANEQALANAPQFNEQADHWGFELAAYANAWTAVNATRAQSAVAVGGTPWSFAANGTPLNGTYFIASNAQAAQVQPGDQFNDTLNPGKVFTVSNVGGNFAGFNNISFYPMAAGKVMGNPAPGEPLVGAFLSEGGIGVGDFTHASAQWANWTGISIPVARFYQLTTYTVTTDLSQAIAAGVKLCISLSPPYNPVSATDLASITTFMQALKAAGANCDIALWHEPSFSGLTAAQYVAMIQYYGPVIRQYYPLVCVYSGTTDTNPANGYYPGDTWCDKIAVDAYAGSPTTQITNAQSIADTAVPPKPFGIWEFNGSLGINNLTGDNYNPAVTIGNWTAIPSPSTVNCSIARVAQSGPVNTTWAWGLTSLAAGNMGAGSAPAANYATQMLACAAGDEIVAGCWLKAATAGRSCMLGADFFTSAGVFISTVYSADAAATVTDSTSGWTAALGTLIAPATAAWCRMNVRVSSTGAAGEVHYFNLAELRNSTQTGNTKAVVTTFFTYVLALMAARRAAGKPNADIMYYNGVFPAVSLSSGTVNAADYRLPLWNAIYTAFMTSTVTQVLPAASWPSDGSHSLLITAAGGAGLWYASSPAGTSGLPVNPGDLVSAAADVYTPAALGHVVCNVDWYNAAGTYLSTTSGGAPLAMAAGDVTTVHAVNAKAPSTAAFFRISVGDNETVSAGTLLYVDNVRVSPRMGVQTRKEYAAFLREIAALDQGILKETRDAFGLGYKTRIGLINQVPAVSLDYSKGMLSPPLAPVVDTQKTTNKVTVSRTTGSKVTVSLDNGTMSTQEPPGGIGTMQTWSKVVASDDGQLAALAAHLLNLGTVTDERYPTISVNLARASIPGNALAPLMSAVANVEIGDYVQLVNLPFWYPSATAKQLVIGYTETIGPRSWEMTWNCQQESGWEIVVSGIRRW